MSATKYYYHDAIEAAMQPTKERPILFSGPMVSAILSLQKTQTRRRIKNLPCSPQKVTYIYFEEHMERWVCECMDGKIYTNSLKCPYGRPGERLWVRETWCYAGHNNAIREMEDYFSPIYRASENGQLWGKNDFTWRWRPSIHMPRAASRLLLEITDISAQRLQDITAAEARSEGCTDPGPIAIGQFVTLWETINGAGAWTQNPWVWVITFKKL